MASFFVALVVMITMLALGIYLDPLPKVKPQATRRAMEGRGNVSRDTGV